MKAIRIGEMAMSNPTLINGKRFMERVYGALVRLDSYCG
jgi:hypothetical protein